MNQTRLIIGLLIIFWGISFFITFPFFKTLLALAIIFIGIRIIMGENQSFATIRGETHENLIIQVLIMSSIHKKYLGENFSGGEIVAIMGSAELDLSQVKTNDKEITLELVSIMSGIKLKVPENWIIKSEGIGILGSFNANIGNSTKESVIATIKGVSILGGVEVINY